MTIHQIQALSERIKDLERELLTLDPLAKAADVAVSDSMRHLKECVDGLRATLWCYLEDQGSDVLPTPRLIKMARMNRVVEIFRELRNNPLDIN